jgi:hydrogenase maturation protein HypF
MRLEAIADPTAAGSYELPLCEGELCELDWRCMFQSLLRDVQGGVEPGIVAMRVHRTLAQGIVSVCRQRPLLPVVLAGGVFQNRLLTELIVQMWQGRSQPLGLPGLIPPNDGGLAAGQLAIAAARGDYLPCA